LLDKKFRPVKSCPKKIWSRVSKKVEKNSKGA
jgi:hypothetical protein